MNVHIKLAGFGTSDKFKNHWYIVLVAFLSIFLASKTARLKC